MSEHELNRIEVLRQVIDGRMTITVAANVSGLSRREVRRLCKVIEAGSDPSDESDRALAVF